MTDVKKGTDTEVPSRGSDGQEDPLFQNGSLPSTAASTGHAGTDEGVAANPVRRCHEQKTSVELEETIPLSDIVNDVGSLSRREGSKDSRKPRTWWRHFRGYKAMIMFASFCFYIISCGASFSLGVYFMELKNYFEVSSTLTALTLSLFTGIKYLTAPISSCLTDRYGFRVVVIIGGLIATISCIAASFANNIYPVLVAFAIFTPFGLGLAYVPGNTIPFLYYGEDGRTFVMGFITTGCGIGAFVMTQILAAAIEAYTWRGAMLISAGILLQIVVLGALMRTPKKWKEIEEMQKKEKYSALKRIVNIYKRPELAMYIVHYTILQFALSIIYVHIAAVTETLSLATKQQAALPLSLIGLSQIVGRTASGIIGHMKRVDTFLFYCLATLAAGGTIMLVPLLPGYQLIAACCFIFGLLLAPSCSLFNIVILYFCDLPDLNAAFAQMTLLSGLGYLAGAPMAGWLYDITGNYGASIYLGGAIMISSCLLLIKPYMSYRRQRMEKDFVVR